MAKWIESVVEFAKNNNIELSKKDIMLATPLFVVASENPKKPGSMAHARFQAYLDKRPSTIADAFDAGLRQDDIRHDSAKGYILLGDAANDADQAANPTEEEFEASMRALV